MLKVLKRTLGVVIPTLCIVVLSVASANSARAEIRYQLTDLGRVEGAYQTVTEQINNDGLIFGHFFTQTGNQAEIHTYLYKDGKFNPVTTPDGYSDYFPNGSINDRGQLVQHLAILNGKYTEHINAFIRDPNGDFTNVNPDPASLFSEAMAINNSGEVLGISYSFDPVPFFENFLYSNGTYKLLDVNVPGKDYVELKSINDAGQILGTAYNVNADGSLTNGQAFVLEKDGQITNIGALLKSATEAIALNNKGDVAIKTSKEGYLYKNGNLIDLGVIHPYAVIPIVINDNGQILQQTLEGPFIYINGEKVSLKSVTNGSDDWFYFGASWINNDGVIVGSGSKTGDQYAHALLLTPVSK